MITCLVIINTFMEAKAGITEFVYLVGIFDVIANLVVDYTG